MKQQRTNDSLQAGQVQLPFMANAPAEVKQPRIKPDTAPRADADAFKVVYPMINDQVFALMMDKYRVFVQEYNARTKIENIETENHNAEVQRFLATVPEALKNAAANFPMRRENIFLRDREYNAAADVLNAQFGPIIYKRKLHILKYTTEQFFANFLHMYSRQLEQRNTERMRLRITEPVTMPALKINSYLTTQLQRSGGVISLNVCSKTVRNHRQHLEDAGVLINYNFRGHKAAVEVQINPEILTVFELRTNRVATPEKQSVTAENRKSLPDNDEITGAYKEEYKEKNGAGQPFGDKESAKPTGFLRYGGISYRFTGCKVENLTEGGAAAGENFKKNIADELRKCIMHPQELAEALAAGEFNQYVPIDIRYLKAAAYDGMMGANEYRELVIQELLKQSAKIWLHSTPYAGSWKKAITHWMQHKFLSFNGAPFSPTNVFAYIGEYRWRLEQARRWYLRKNVTVKPLFPSDYFDITRKTTKEVGFEGTLKMWKNHLKGAERLPEEERKRKKKAETRLRNLSDNSKFNREMKRYLKGSIDELQLATFVQNNLPRKFYDNLPAEIAKRQAEQYQKSSAALK